jgi:carotenoid cleavage dioxygenase
MNSYEEGDNIVIDVARFSHIWRDGAMDFPPPVLWRWVINTKTGKVSEEQVDDRPGEFPRVADSVIGRKHRFGYEMSAPELGGSDSPLDDPGAIIKYDRVTGARTSIELGKGRSPGEAVFVPAENPSSEDDGYLMTYVFDKAKNTSDFVIFDAQTMSQEPIASVHLPRVPFGFHGSWVDASVAN